MAVQIISREEQELTRTARRWWALILLVVGFAVGVAGWHAGLAITNRMPLTSLQPLSRVGTLPHAAMLDKHHIDSRLILIGDVHGMYDELQKLLKKVDYNKKKDTIVFLGDMITKGYDSLGVVDFAIKHGAYCVRGNHEDEIMTLYASEYNLGEPKTYPPFASATSIVPGTRPSATLSATPGPRLDTLATAAPDAPEASEDIEKRSEVDAKDKDRDLPLVRKLKRRHMKYLQNCPAMLQLGQVSKRGIEAVAVHGGLLWNEHVLENQKIEDVLRIRSIVPPDYTRGSEDPDDGEPWFDKWGEEQRSRPKNERFEVFYGHDASKGLQLHRYSKGLDTRCQRGGKLSAYVVRVTHEGKYHEDLVQVKC